MRESYPDAVIQLNHPTGGGVGDAADWSPGKIGSGNRWTENFDAVEVLNSYEHEEFFEFYADITNRGIRSTPIGVSDSHGYFSGGPGLNVTFFNVGHSDPMKLTNEELKTAITDAAVVISMGPFLETSPLPGSTISGSTTLNVTIKAPTWVPISRLDLLKNGEVETSIDAPDLDAIHAFELEPEQDAWYVVVATGEESMQPVSDRIPWAMTSPIRTDVDGQGWSAPLPPLTVTP